MTSQARAVTARPFDPDQADGPEPAQRGRSQSLSVTATLACLIQAERPAEAGRIASGGPSRGRAQ